MHGLSDNVPLPSAYVPGGSGRGAVESDDDETSESGAAGNGIGASSERAGRAVGKKREGGEGREEQEGAKGGGGGLTKYLSKAISKVASTVGDAGAGVAVGDKGAAVTGVGGLGVSVVEQGMGGVATYNVDSGSVESDGDLAAKVKISQQTQIRI